MDCNVFGILSLVFPNLQGACMETADNHSVVIVDVKMPFLSMVVFMVKWVIAAIPAFIILGILGSIVAALFGGMAGH